MSRFVVPTAFVTTATASSLSSSSSSTSPSSPQGYHLPRQRKPFFMKLPPPPSSTNDLFAPKLDFMMKQQPSQQPSSNNNQDKSSKKSSRSNWSTRSRNTSSSSTSSPPPSQQKPYYYNNNNNSSSSSNNNNNDNNNNNNNSILKKKTIKMRNSDDYDEASDASPTSIMSMNERVLMYDTSNKTNTTYTVTEMESFSSKTTATNISTFFTNATNATTSAITVTTSRRDYSIFLLNLVAILWGSQHAVIKSCVGNDMTTTATTATAAVASLDPSFFTMVRFGLAACLATPTWFFNTDRITTTKENKVDLKTTWRWGLEMGFWMFLGYAFQAIGLESTTAQRSGFFLYLNVKFVPFFAYLLLGRNIRWPTLASAVVAFVGTACLAYDPTMQSFNMTVGDLWSIAAAAASAMFILRLEVASTKVTNAAALNVACLWVVTMASSIWASIFMFKNENSSMSVLSTVGTTSTIDMTSHGMGLFTLPFDLWNGIVQTLSSHPWELLYLSLVTTALCNWIQTKAQRHVTAERAAVIYAMDPVYGALWANALLGERLSEPYGIIGAMLIVCAAATNAMMDFGKDQQP